MVRCAVEHFTHYAAFTKKKKSAYLHADAADEVGLHHGLNTNGASYPWQRLWHGAASPDDPEASNMIAGWQKQVLVDGEYDVYLTKVLVHGSQLPTFASEKRTRTYFFRNRRSPIESEKEAKPTLHRHRASSRLSR